MPTLIDLVKLSSEEMNFIKPEILILLIPLPKHIRNDLTVLKKMIKDVHNIWYCEEFESLKKII